MNRRRMFLLVSLACLGLIIAAGAAVARADDIPGVPIPPSPIQGYLDNSNGSGVNLNDVYSVSMVRGARLTCVLNGDSSSQNDFILQLFGPGTMGVIGTAPLVTIDNQCVYPYPKTLSYTASAAGLYYLNVLIGSYNIFTYTPEPYEVSGAYSVAWTCQSPTVTKMATHSHTVRSGSRVTVKGSLKYAIGGNAIAGAKVRLQGSANGKNWAKGTVGTTTSSGAFAFKVKVTKARYFHVVFSGTRALIASKSIVIRLKVK